MAPGIHIIPAPGHTPGHLAFWLTSGSQRAVFVADAVLGETNFGHPDWTSVFDTDPALSIICSHDPALYEPLKPRA